jgi:hypothetical protein
MCSLDAPQRLKRELDTVLNLQSDLDSIEKAICDAKGVISVSAPSSDTLEAFSGLQHTHERLMSKVEVLYASLNVHEKFPELRELPLDFVRTLLMARDLKINIRKRAIGSFFEWERLDQAVGGKDQALGSQQFSQLSATLTIVLGTKLHQHTRKSITKRQPALITAIRKYNKYCEHLEELSEPDCSFPVPRPLPTNLTALRDDSDLMEDVWVAPPEDTIPLWLDNTNIRKGIQAMLKRDRCLEEQRRLEMEADNLCRWFGRELLAVELALVMPSSMSLPFTISENILIVVAIADKDLYVLLSWRRDHLLSLQSQWATPFVSQICFESHVQIAYSISAQVSQHPRTHNITSTVVIDDILEPGDLPVENAVGTPTDHVLMADLLSDEFEDDQDDAKPPLAYVKWELPVCQMNSSLFFTQLAT